MKEYAGFVLATLPQMDELEAVEDISEREWFVLKNVVKAAGCGQLATLDGNLDDGNLDGGNLDGGNIDDGNLYKSTGNVANDGGVDTSCMQLGPFITLSKMWANWYRRQCMYAQDLCLAPSCNAEDNEDTENTENNIEGHAAAHALDAVPVMEVLRRMHGTTISRWRDAINNNPNSDAKR
jgi:hypothetical protein